MGSKTNNIGNIKMNYVYIMTNKNNSTIYVGVTSNLSKRIYEHIHGIVDGFTKRYNLHKLVYFEQIESITDAIEREKQIKRLHRKNKEFLVNQLNPNWEDLTSKYLIL